MKRFVARLQAVPHGGCFVVVPDDVAAAAGVRYKDRVRGTVDGVGYRSSLMKYSGVFHLGIAKASLAEAGVGVGDEVRVGIEHDPEPLPTDLVPDDLARALARNRAAAAAFAALPPSHKREHVGFVIEAKKPETRARRIEKTIATLASARR